MPRQSKAVERILPERTLVVDNGAYTIKAGFANSLPNPDTDCHVIPNFIAKSRDNRIWIGAQMEECSDYGDMGFRRPIQKGFLVNWEAEREIWEKTFLAKDAKVKCDPHDTSLLLTEAPNCPVALQSNCDQMVFEEFEFAAYRRCVGPSLNAFNDIGILVEDPPRTIDLDFLPVECVLVIDSGYSHTTVTPVYKGRPIQQAIRRLEMGSKVLTNYMKEMLSVRQMDVRDETHLINQMKEDTCFVSSNFRNDLESIGKGPLAAGRKAPRREEDIVVDFVLPDYSTRMRGEVRPHDPTTMPMRTKVGAVTNADGVKEYIMALGNERFAVPELLFNPGDIGMKQAGLPETVMQSMSGLPPGLWPSMLSNILVIGGNAKFDGFLARLSSEIRQLAPAECPVRVAIAPDPIKSTWLGGARLAGNKIALKDVLVTRQEYQEYGSAWLLKRFAAGSTN
ncbi:Actin- protein 6 [Xylographa opegraphella]|nr:Actin- protein 6 [Xylographa opegraphella]